MAYNVETALYPHEKVILRVQKHPLILFGQILPLIILDYIPYLLPKVGIFLDEANSASVIAWTSVLSFSNPWVAFIVGVYWLFIWMAMFGLFINHFLDEWVITNERIIDINQRDFWSRDVSSVLLVRVQDVESDVSGLFHTLFGFGKVTVESAGADSAKTCMRGLSNPRQVRDLIMKEAMRARKEEFSSLKTE
jgi:uncharacterized membrane protein YdbT with pleckstrin-like domain